MTSRLDVVVVNYRTPVDLSAFLDTFDAYRPTVDWGLWVCNVDPEFEDVQVVQQLRRGLDLPLHHLIWETNVGYAKACNAAAAEGEGDVIAFFNADVRLTAGALDACYGALKSRADWGVLGPRQVDDLGRIVHAGIFGPDTKPRHRGWRELSGYDDVSDDCFSVAGSAYFVKRRVWQELTDCPIYQGVAEGADGAFLPTQLWWEETWCSVHARAHGHKVAYLGPVTLTHRLSQSIKKNRVAFGVMEDSHEYFRAACRAHDLEHD